MVGLRNAKKINEEIRLPLKDQTNIPQKMRGIPKREKEGLNYTNPAAVIIECNLLRPKQVTENNSHSKQDQIKELKVILNRDLASSLISLEKSDNKYLQADTFQTRQNFRNLRQKRSDSTNRSQNLTEPLLNTPNTGQKKLKNSGKLHLKEGLKVMLEQSPECNKEKSVDSTNQSLLVQKIPKTNLETPKEMVDSSIWYSGALQLRDKLQVILERSPECNQEPNYLSVEESNLKTPNTGHVTKSYSRGSVHLTGALKVMLEQSPDFSTEFLGFSEKEISGIPKTPKSSRLVKACTPRTLAVMLEKLGSSNNDDSPEFLGFPAQDREIHPSLIFSPKTLQVFITRLNSVNDSVESNSCEKLDRNNLKNGRDSNDTNNQELQNSLENKSGPRVLKIILKKHNKLEKRLLTQIDGVYHLSETDLETTLTSPPLSPNKATSNTFSLISPDFKGFQKERSRSPDSRRLLKNSLQEIDEYLSMLNEECNQEYILVECSSDKVSKIKRNFQIAERRNINDVKKTKETKSSSDNMIKTIKSRNLAKTDSTKETERTKVVSNNLDQNVTRRKKNDDVVCLGKEFLIDKNQKNKENRAQPNLRKLPEKNYLEESTIINSEQSTSQESLPSKKIPIYKQQVSVNKPSKPADEYEFIDISPKKKVERKQTKRSSGFFEKDTYHIVKKLEKKEQLKKKKEARINNNKKGSKKKDKGILSYETISQNILSNVLKKVNKRIQPTLNTITEVVSNESTDHQLEKEDITFANPKAPLKAAPLGRRPCKNVPEKSHDITTTRKSEVLSKPTVHITDSTQIEAACHQVIVEAIIHSSPEVVLFDQRRSQKLTENSGDQITPESVVHLNPKVPSKVVPVNSHNMITTRKPKILSCKEQNIVAVFNKQNSSIVPDIDYNKPSTNENITIEKVKEFPSPVMPVENESQQNVSLDDQTTIQDQIEDCFGFIQQDSLPQTSTPAVSKVNLIANVVVNRGVPQSDIDSPVNFHGRRPNANSTMLGSNLGLMERNRRSSESPWRLELKHVRQNPHFVSIKTNALPRIDQEMVLDHTLVEEYESHCTKTSETEETKKSPVQQSILNYIECDDRVLEKENLNKQRSSLFDYEAFSSPVKRNAVKNDNVQTVKRKVFEEISLNNVDSISTDEEPQHISDENNLTYFGFDEMASETKRKQKSDKTNQIKATDAAKPSRFDLNLIKKYKSRKDREKEKQVEAVPIEDVPSVSILNVTNDSTEDDSLSNDADIRLFDEPEELFDSKPVEVKLKRTKRCRADSVDDPDETDKKHKRHKRTQFEIEQDQWIKSFTKELEDVERFDLEAE